MPELTKELFGVYFSLFSMALIPIYIGSFRSLNPSSVDAISSKDAYMFPVIGSCVLLSIYLLFKFLSKELVNLIMSIYFTILGVGAITAMLHPIFKNILPYDFVKKKPIKLIIPLPKFIRKEPIEIVIHHIDFIGGTIGTVIGIWYILTKHWIANNIIGECFATVGVELISLGSYLTGCILLGGLFFYDIFWVFGTDVMETVAKMFDAPIKVVWPRGTGFSLLGLGDIVIPGIFIAMMLRFDEYLAKKRKKPNNRLYFHVCFISYILALVMTIAVLHIFGRGQPALLYIVPCVILSTFGLALIRGELSLLFSYTEGNEKKDKKE